MAAHYDDPSFYYDQYWQGREYENESEILAIGRLLANRHFKKSVDIGGGYGRLISFISKFSQKTILIEPSLKQRNLAVKYLSKTKNKTIMSGTAQRTNLPSTSVDLALMVRVMHHLPDPSASLKEINRILKPDGTFILEFANSYHFKARIASFFTGQPILPTPLDKRSNSSIRHHTIAFVNHHPSSVIKLLNRSGFVIDQFLSVSNLRSPFLKKYLPHNFLLFLEKHLQSPLAKSFFGPSIFVLAHKG